MNLFFFSRYMLRADNNLAGTDQAAPDQTSHILRFSRARLPVARLLLGASRRVNIDSFLELIIAN